MHIDEFISVADSFHTKPIRRYIQLADRFHVLGLTLRDVKLYEGNRHQLIELDLESGVPKTIDEALGNELTDQHLTFASYGGADGPGMVHGHGDKSEEIDIDSERFFRVVSAAIAENFSKPTSLPLILCALPEHHSLFQRVSNNRDLLQNGIPLNPKSVSNHELSRLAWEVIEPGYKKRIKKICDQFEQARSHGKGSDFITDIVKAAEEGRVDTLLIDYSSHPQIDDLLDDLGELVTRTGGDVLILPQEEIPSESGAAAIFRY